MQISTPLLLDVLTGGASWTQLIPGATDDPLGLWDRLLDPGDAFDLPDAEHAAEAVIEHLTGWLPHAAYALAGLVDQQWAVVSGRATAGGVDLLELPVARVLAFAYALRVENAEENDRRKLDEALTRPRMNPRARRRITRRAAEPASTDRVVADQSAPPPGFTVAEQRGSFLAVAAMIGGAQS